MQRRTHICQQCQRTFDTAVEAGAHRALEHWVLCSCCVPPLAFTAAEEARQHRRRQLRMRQQPEQGDVDRDGDGDDDSSVVDENFDNVGAHAVDDGDVHAIDSAVDDDVGVEEQGRIAAAEHGDDAGDAAVNPSVDGHGNEQSGDAIVAASMIAMLDDGGATHASSSASVGSDDFGDAHPNDAEFDVDPEFDRQSSRHADANGDGVDGAFVVAFEGAYDDDDFDDGDGADDVAVGEAHGDAAADTSERLIAEIASLPGGARVLQSIAQRAADRDALFTASHHTTPTIATTPSIVRAFVNVDGTLWWHDLEDALMMVLSGSSVADEELRRRIHRRVGRPASKLLEPLRELVELNSVWFDVCGTRCRALRPSVAIAFLLASCDTSSVVASGADAAWIMHERDDDDDDDDDDGLLYLPPSMIAGDEYRDAVRCLQSRQWPRGTAFAMLNVWTDSGLTRRWTSASLFVVLVRLCGIGSARRRHDRAVPLAFIPYGVSSYEFWRQYRLMWVELEHGGVRLSASLPPSSLDASVDRSVVLPFIAVSFNDTPQRAADAHSTGARGLVGCPMCLCPKNRYGSTTIHNISTYAARSEDRLLVVGAVQQYLASVDRLGAADGAAGAGALGTTAAAFIAEVSGMQSTHEPPKLLPRLSIFDACASSLPGVMHCTVLGVGKQALHYVVSQVGGSALRERLLLSVRKCSPRQDWGLRAVHDGMLARIIGDDSGKRKGASKLNGAEVVAVLYLLPVALLDPVLLQFTDPGTLALLMELAVATSKMLHYIFSRQRLTIDQVAELHTSFVDVHRRTTAMHREAGVDIINIHNLVHLQQYKLRHHNMRLTDEGDEFVNEALIKVYRQRALNAFGGLGADGASSAAYERSIMEAACIADGGVNWMQRSSLRDVIADFANAGGAEDWVEQGQWAEASSSLPQTLRLLSKMPRSASLDDFRARCGVAVDVPIFAKLQMRYLHPDDEVLQSVIGFLPPSYYQLEMFAAASVVPGDAHLDVYVLDGTCVDPVDGDRAARVVTPARVMAFAIVDSVAVAFVRWWVDAVVEGALMVKALELPVVQLSPAYDKVDVRSILRRACVLCDSSDLLGRRHVLETRWSHPSFGLHAAEALDVVRVRGGGGGQNQ